MPSTYVDIDRIKVAELLDIIRTNAADMNADRKRRWAFGRASRSSHVVQKFQWMLEQDNFFTYDQIALLCKFARVDISEYVSPADRFRAYREKKAQASRPKHV